MNKLFYRSKYRALCFAVVSIAIGCTLAACGKSEKTVSSTPQMTKKFEQNTLLQGVVISNNRLENSAEIKVTDISGKVLAHMQLNGDKHYQLEIPAGTELPILLRFYPQPDSATAQQMLVVVVDQSITKYDISPLTTAIAHKAEALGGYTRANMVMAAESMVNAPDANKTSTGFRGDPTTQYGGWH